MVHGAGTDAVCDAASLLGLFAEASGWSVPESVPELLRLESRWRGRCRRLGLTDADMVQLLFREALGLTPAVTHGRDGQ